MPPTDDLRRGYVPDVALEALIPKLTLSQMAKEVARRYPQRIALDFFSRSVTHAQLVDRVRRAASVPARMGVASDDCIVPMIPNCPQHVIAALAAVILGDVIVEHNPLFPVLEIEKEFEACGARVVIAWEKSIDKLTFLEDEVTVFSTDLTRVVPGAAQFLLRLPVKTAKEKCTALSVKPPTRTRP